MRASSCVDLRPVVIDHRVDDAVQQRDRAFGQQALRLGRTRCSSSAMLRPQAVVHGDQVGAADEEVDVVRVEGPRGSAAKSMP